MSRALVFDCDGVLADTELDGHLVAFNQVFEELGHDFRWSAEEYARLLKVGGGKERLRKYLADHPEIDFAGVGSLDDAVAEFHKRKSAVYVDLVEAGRLPGRPGVRRIIEEALDAGWQVAVASTSAEKSVRAVLRSVIGEESYARIHGVYAGDVVPAKKPAPDIYELAVRELGRSKDEVVVVEDSEAGAKAAEAADLAHVVTVSHFTVEDPFPAATTVVNHLGMPGEPAEVLAGEDVRNADGVIDVASLEKMLELRRAALERR